MTILIYFVVLFEILGIHFDNIARKLDKLLNLNVQFKVTIIIFSISCIAMK